jgi:ADP-ribose pyrophosphatase YjhB (NUDIX family)
MLKKTIAKIWKKTPPFLRLRVIRAAQQKFTVSVAAVVTNDKNEVLLLNHLLRPFASWGIPGGFIEAGEQPEEGVRREIREETGIEIDELRLIRVRTVRRHIEILFRARSNEKGEVKSREITDLGWFTPGNMPEHVSRAQKLLIEKVLRGEI